MTLAVADKKEVREYLRYVHVHDSLMFATDGYRLHWCITEFEDGVYEPKTMLKMESDSWNSFPSSLKDRVKNHLIRDCNQGEYPWVLVGTLEKEEEIYDSLFCQRIGGTLFQKQYVESAEKIRTIKNANLFLHLDDSKTLYGCLSDSSAGFTVMSIKEK